MLFKAKARYIEEKFPTERCKGKRATRHNDDDSHFVAEVKVVVVAVRVLHDAIDDHGIIENGARKDLNSVFVVHLTKIPPHKTTNHHLTVLHRFTTHAVE